ncbi:MAG: endonuclease III domain-containing protein [Candidatus Micrarchaeia archaeon]
MLELKRLYLRLRANFGFLDWWPGDSKEEIVVGAILTQNTAWRNVELAIKNLKEKNMLSLEKLSLSDNKNIETAIRPAGFYKQKTKRIKNLACYILKRYSGLEKFFEKDITELREELLSLNGIGKETADSIILYAADKPTFVIDAYTKRIMYRVYGIEEDIQYDELKRYFENKIKKDLTVYKDFHAQLVELGKRFCKKTPKCGECPIRDKCRYSSINLKMHQKINIKIV